MTEATGAREFLILHGFQNWRDDETHWQYFLVRDLTERGHLVRYPQLPDPDQPVLKDWVAAIEAELRDAAGKKLTVIAHSLACAAWIHLSQQGSVHLPVDRLLFVAPPSPDFLAAEPLLAEFVTAPGSHLAVAGSSRTQPRLACSALDRTCSPPADELYPGVFSADRIAAGGHLDTVAGYGRWPSLLDWCERPESRLTSNR